MSKMVYLPYVHFEQEEGEAEGIGWYFTQYNACRTASLKRNARAANRKQSSLM